MCQKSPYEDNSSESEQDVFAWGRAGEGEFGVVHKALWNGSQVAAKILKGSSAIALGDFRSEIEVLRKVHHPNAVQFLGALAHSCQACVPQHALYGRFCAHDRMWLCKRCFTRHTISGFSPLRVTGFQKVWFVWRI